MKSMWHTGDAGETLGINRVHTHRDAAQAGIFERLRHFGQKVAIRGQRDVELIPIDSSQFGEFTHEIHHSLAQQWLAAGDTNLLDT